MALFLSVLRCSHRPLLLFGSIFKGQRLSVCVFAFCTPFLSTCLFATQNCACKSVNIFKHCVDNSIRHRCHKTHKNPNQCNLADRGNVHRRNYGFFQNERTNGNFTHIADLMCDASRAHTHSHANPQNLLLLAVSTFSSLILSQLMCNAAT